MKAQQSFATVPLSRWKFEFGVCHLVSFSHGFSGMLHIPSDALLTNFTCLKMYPTFHHQKRHHFYAVIGCGLIDSITTKIPVMRGDGKVVDIFAILNIEYENNIPTIISCCMNEFVPINSFYAELPYFEPFDVKTRKPTSIVHVFESLKKKDQDVPKSNRDSCNNETSNCVESAHIFMDDLLDTNSTINL